MMMMKCSVPPNAPMALPGAVVTRERQYEPVSFKDTANRLRTTRVAVDGFMTFYVD